MITRAFKNTLKLDATENPTKLVDFHRPVCCYNSIFHSYKFILYGKMSLKWQHAHSQTVFLFIAHL